MLSQFNIFEAIGVDRQELRHSSFLSFLLDPQKPHGLGDAFAKRLLQRVLMASAPRNDLTPIHLDLWSLGAMTVEREWRNIDLLLIDEPNRLVVVIENKIGSGEHSDQLGRYRKITNDRFADWKQLFVFLTPEGDIPSDEENVSLDYGSVCELVEAIAESRKPSLDPSVYAMMTHYARMLRRHVVTDSEIAELCRRIYQKHRRALDVIREHVPGAQAEMHQVLVDFIARTDGLVLDRSTQETINFTLSAWDLEGSNVGGGGWTKSRRMVMFEWKNLFDALRFTLYVGPGPREVRDLLINAARDAGNPFAVGSDRSQRHTTIFDEYVLKPADFEASAPEERFEQVGRFCDQFVQHQLPSIRDSLVPTIRVIADQHQNPTLSDASLLVSPGGTS